MNATEACIALNMLPTVGPVRLRKLLQVFKEPPAILAAKGRTIAVIGSGLSKLYPPENRALAEKIRDGNGAVVSEFSMEVEPDRQTFPMRNRIISGWSHGILVVEAGVNSGALITASQALEQGRAVYAVPGH